jgi:prophage DNA circulation protein
MKLFTARLDDYFLNILDISDTESMSIAVHEFVQTDGAILDQQGRHAREVKFRAFFFAHAVRLGGQYIDPTYGNHFSFVEGMSDSSTSHILVHPKYGQISGYVRSMTITHDDTQDYVAIDIDFVEKDIQTSGYIADQNAVDRAMNIQQADLLDAQLTAMNNDLNSMGMGSILGKTINATQSLVDQFNTATAGVRDFLKSTDSFLNQVDQLAHLVTEPFTTVTGAVAFVNDVPSRFIGSINSACNRVIGSFVALSNSPATMMNNITVSLSGFVSIITGVNASFFKTKFLTLCAGSVAWQTGQTFQADQNKRAVLAMQETKPTFDRKGNRIAAIQPIDVMSVQEIEAVLYNTRQLIQQAIIANREILGEDSPQLKQMAATLVQFTNSIKLISLNQKTVTVNNMPLHVLLQQLGLSYNAGDRILKLNPQIRCPNFVEGDVRVYVS